MTERLQDPYASALGEAIAYIHSRYQPVGIIVSGTIIRGAPDASSDFDFMVIHEPSWRQRVQRFFNGVPADMFVNPVYEMRRVIAAEPTSGRPVMSHLIGTGEIVHDPVGIMGSLQAQARATLEAGPAIPPESLVLQKYAIATEFEDAVDIRVTDPERAQAMVTDALLAAVRMHFLQNGRWLPRPKTLLAELDALDPALSAEVRQSLHATRLDECLSLAESVMLQITGVTGFFEWESEIQERLP